MKKLLFIFIGLVFSAAISAQTDTINPKPPIPPVPPIPAVPAPPAPPDEPDLNNDDTIKIKVGNYKVIVIDNEKKKIPDGDSFDIDLNKEFDEDFDFDEHDKSYKSWAGFDLGMNYYLNSDNTTKMPPGYEFLEINYRRSFSFGLNLLEKDIPIVKEYVKLAAGAGMEWNNYVFMNNIRLIPDSTVIYGITDSVYNFDKTRLLLTYINFPLLLQFNTNADPKNAFHISVGAILGVNVGATSKLKYDINDRTAKLKTRGDYHISPLRYNLTARVGYGNFKVFVNYSLNSLFVKDEGPELYPFSFGICMIPF
jgi:hypothetical protein